MSRQVAGEGPPRFLGGHGRQVASGGIQGRTRALGMQTGGSPRLLHTLVGVPRLPTCPTLLFGHETKQGQSIPLEMGKLRPRAV